ncbi:hypothetical protein [Anaerovibrio sp. RM50]|uniref:hypothetical protein n=1 Tax=Anaerovibrio sp. RM50 TaxID=1200557 RepID=UPI000480E738|nr:hypothetical protein [Anaerovibrio sp. RM50]
MTQLEDYYNDLLNKYDFEKPLEAGRIGRIIHEELEKFLCDAKNPAIYCNGKHTKNLLSDFVFELRKVKIIIDNYAQGGGSGYKIITKDDIKAEHVDAIVVSSYNYMSQIVKELEEEHPEVKVLNIYDKLRNHGIVLHSNYYYGIHPYHNYHYLNQLQCELLNSDKKNETYFKIINKYIHIKDFKSAIRYCREAFDFTSKSQYEQMATDLEKIYALELEYIYNINENNVLMLCLDGLRGQDVNAILLPQIYKCFKDNWINYSNTYSYSTSTYESLVPAYSENTDMNTKYYEYNYVDGVNCRFVKKALEQQRDIYFYSDGAHYVEQEKIHYSEVPKTISQMLWDFIIDAQNVDNGLFYIHGMYETHFAFLNPYTQAPLIAEGTALLFDLLPVKGGKLRTDYVQQHDDALRYLDDVMAPFLERVNCNVVFYADHGNLLMDKYSTLSDIKKEYLQCGEEWLRIPFFIKNKTRKNGTCKKLHSIMSINDVVISLLENREYNPLDNTYIKIGRSEIYNPDFKKLYKLLGEEKRLQAFEGFIFSDGFKLVVYADGHAELYDLADNELFDARKIEYLLKIVAQDITVMGS